MNLQQWVFLRTVLRRLYVVCTRQRWRDGTHFLTRTTFLNDPTRPTKNMYLRIRCDPVVIHILCLQQSALLRNFATNYKNHAFTFSCMFWYWSTDRIPNLNLRNWIILQYYTTPPTPTWSMSHGRQLTYAGLSVSGLCVNFVVRFWNGIVTITTESSTTNMCA